MPYVKSSSGFQIVEVGWDFNKSPCAAGTYSLTKGNSGSIPAGSFIYDLIIRVDEVPNDNGGTMQINLVGDNAILLGPVPLSILSALTVNEAAGVRDNAGIPSDMVQSTTAEVTGTDTNLYDVLTALSVKGIGVSSSSTVEMVVTGGTITTGKIVLGLVVATLSSDSYST